MYLLWLTRFCIGVIFLLYASFTDYKKRVVENYVWILLGISGITLLVTQLLIESVKVEYYLILWPICVLFSDAFVDRKPIFNTKTKEVNFVWLFLYGMSILIIFYQLYKFCYEIQYLKIFVVPVMVVVAYLLYFTGLLHGGADAKALICLSILTPIYPVLNSFPLWQFDTPLINIVFPFPLVILLNSVILTLFLPLVLAIYNVYKKEFAFPYGFIGYKMNIENVPKKYVWLMEKVKDDKIIMEIFPKRDFSRKKTLTMIEKLKNKGVQRVWVTPKIPFMIPLTIGFIISFVFGNIVYAIIFGLF